MRMYPAYRLADVLQEYAISFFALLNEGYRLRYVDAQLLVQIADMPHMKKEDREKVFRNMKWAATHPGDILKSSGSASSPEDIKKLFGG